MNTDGPPKTVIVKLPNTKALSELYQVREQVPEGGGAADDLVSVMPTMHNDECAVYKMLDEEEIPVLPMARLYAAVPSSPGEEAPLLMLEDMGDRAVAMESFADYLNLEQTYEMVDALASLHAWSARTSVPWRDHVPTLSERKEIYRSFYQLTPALAPLVRDNLSAEFGTISADQVLSLVNFDSHFRIFAPEATPRQNLPVVLVHGDVHCSNAMFEKSSDGKAGNKLMAMLDFQLVHVGYGVEDVARLLAMGTSSAIRREYCDAVLERYVEVFNANVGEGKHIQLRHVKEAYEDMFCIVAIWFAMSAGFAEDILKKALEKVSEEEKKMTLRSFILNSACMYRDAAKMLGWH